MGQVWAIALSIAQPATQVKEVTYTCTTVQYNNCESGIWSRVVTHGLYGCCTLLQHTMCSAIHVHWDGMDRWKHSCRLTWASPPSRSTEEICLHYNTATVSQATINRTLKWLANSLSHWWQQWRSFINYYFCHEWDIPWKGVRQTPPKHQTCMHWLK